MANLRGQLGEDIAVDYLTRRGYAILARNWRSRFGEVDIIAQDGSTLVLVEVKTRRRKQGRFGTPLEAINQDKVRRLSRLAAGLVSQYRFRGPVRLDVVAVAGNQLPELIRGIEPIDISG